MGFKPGESGNPAGRPVGSKDKRATYREQLEENAPAIINKAVELALKGDMTALKICIDRILPTLKAVELSTQEDEESYEGLITRLARQEREAKELGP